MNKILRFLKRNILSLISGILAFIVLFSGVISYSKYMSGENVGENTVIGLFSYSAIIDDVSALSFTNTSFWNDFTGGEGSVAMNATRTIDFSINNFEGDKVNAVRTGYAITFTAPKIFAEQLAFQVIGEDSTALTPQIVVGDIVKYTSFNTKDQTDYNGDKFIYEVYDKNGNKVEADSEDGNGLYFTVSKSTVNSRDAYTATAKTPDGDFVITITQREEIKEQILQFRLWDVTNFTNNEELTVKTEGGQLMSPLTVVTEESLIYYDVTVSTPDFELPAGVATTHKHRVKLVPIDTLLDRHLGGTMVDTLTGEQLLELYSGQVVNVQSVDETVSIYRDEGKTQLISTHAEPLFGAVKQYQQGHSNTVKNTSFSEKVKVYPNTSDLSNALKTVTDSGWVEISRDLGDEVIKMGTASGNSTVTYNRNTYARCNATKTVTNKVTSRQTVVTRYQFPISEISTYSTSYVTTYVISTTEEDGHQSAAELRETTETFDSVETKPVGSIEMTETVVRERTVTTVTTDTGTAYFRRTGRNNNNYVYYEEDLYPGTDNRYMPAWEDTTTTTSTENAPEQVTWTDMVETTVIIPGQTVTTETVMHPETTVYKSISREFISVDMTIKQVSYTPANEDGTYGETTVYTEDSPFRIMETSPNAYGNYEQKYHVSQCFLKSYPLSVNMTFEQMSKND